MAFEPSNAYEEVFIRMYDLTPAQRRSRLMECCMPLPEAEVGDKFHYNRIGEVEDQIKVGRNPVTPQNPAPHDKRIGFRQTRHINIPIDRADLRRMIANPASEYVERVRQLHGKRMDENIIASLGGDAMQQDHDASVATVALPAAQKIAAGGAGLTLTKVIEAAKRLNAAEVGDIQENPRTLLIGSEQLAEALAIEQLSSADYNTLKVLFDGEVAHFMGFMWKRVEFLPLAGTTRRCYAFTKDAVRYASDEGLTYLSIVPDPGRSHTPSVYAEWEVGSLRTAEERVVEISCEET